MIAPTLPASGLTPAELMPAVLPLRGYQKRYVDDSARFKISVKSARIGFSFATALEAVLDCLNGKTTWTVLSASKPQSVEFIQACSDLIELMLGTVQLYEDESFFDSLGSIEAIQQRVTFPNGARIIALPANPRTARGYPGNAILDEFAHHDESYAIWAAITRQTALGHKVRVVSTPNGEQGKFYDLCKELDLVDGIAPPHNYSTYKGWSVYWIDAPMAIADGCPINMAEMRQLIQDEDIVNQEFYCQFLKSSGAWLPLALIQQSEDRAATLELPEGYVPRGKLYGGIDVGRVRDATTIWLKEEQPNGVLLTRMVRAIHGMPFPDQAKLLAPFVRMTHRTAIDSTGMGIALYDLLIDGQYGCAGKVLGVNFAGSSRTRDEEKARASSSRRNTPDGAVKMKVDLAIKIKRAHEAGKERIPYDMQIRTELQAIKREPTDSGVTFDAPRVQVETAVAGGVARKSYAHADRFWAHALATYAAAGQTVELGMTQSTTPSMYSRMKGFL